MMVSSSDYDAVEEWTTVADFRRFSFRTNSCRIPIERRGVRCVRLYLATADNSNLEPGDITVILLSQRKNADWRTVDTDGRGWPLVYCKLQMNTIALEKQPICISHFRSVGPFKWSAWCQSLFAQALGKSRSSL